jgi:hypothetical protein
MMGMLRLLLATKAMLPLGAVHVSFFGFPALGEEVQGVIGLVGHVHGVNVDAQGPGDVVHALTGQIRAASI